MRALRQPYRFLDPKVAVKLSNLTMIARLVVEGFTAGLHTSPYKGFSAEFSEYRKYSWGDSVKDIDWKVYGKRDRYYVKEFQEETNLKAYILLDASASMDYRSEGVSKRFYANCLAASLAHLMIRQKDAVGLVAFDDQIRSFITPRSTPSHLRSLLLDLEKQRSGGQTNLSGTFHALAERIRRRALIIILSDLFDDQDSVLRGLKHFRHNKHEVLVFHILDPAELRFPFDDSHRFIDLETKEEKVVPGHLLRDSYLSRLKDFLDEYRRGCSESFIDYQLVDTSKPFDAFLMEYLYKRAKLG